MYEYWLNFCRTNNWNEKAIEENADISLQEIKKIFLSNPINTINLEKKELSFIVGDNLADFIKKYKIELIDAISKYPQSLSLSKKKLLELMRKRFKSLTFEELISLCKKNNFDVDLINENLGELRKTVCSVALIKKNILKHPLKVLNLDIKALEFLFDFSKAEFIISYKPVISAMIEKDSNFKFEFWKIRTEILKYFEDILIKCKFNEQLFTKKIEKEGYKKEQLCKNFGSIRRFFYRQLSEKIDFTNPEISRINKILEKLISINNEKDIYELIDESNIDIFALKNSIHSFLLAYHLNEYSSLQQILFSKIDIYLKNRSYERKKKKEIEEKLKLENKLEKAKEIIKNFIDSNHEIKLNFCVENSISKDYFDACVNLVKGNDYVLYSLYIKKISNNKDKKYATFVYLIKKIVNYMKFGIEENGRIRQFDLLDYYQIIYLSRTEFLKIAKDVLSPLEINIILRFLKKYSNVKLLKQSDIKQILEEKIIVGVEFDSNNKSIPNTGRIITKEEKQNIINYLKENNVPLYDDCYNIALRRYVNGDLVFEEIKSKNK